MDNFTCKLSFTPTKVTIWPLAQTKEEERTIEYLNNDDGLTEITKYCGQVALGQNQLILNQYFIIMLRKC